MKKIYPILALSVLLVACGSSENGSVSQTIALSPAHIVSHPPPLADWPSGKASDCKAKGSGIESAAV